MCHQSVFERIDLSALSIIFDWLGSVLMLGTVWGWVYGKISPAIKDRLRRAKRRNAAIRRYMIIKYGAEPNQIPSVKRYLAHRERIGIYESTSIWASLAQQREEKKIRKRLEQYGLATDEDRKTWEKIDADRKDAVRIMLIYGWNTLKSGVQFRLMRVVDLFTISLFTGRLGAALFLIGFVLWNVSKALSLYTLK